MYFSIISLKKCDVLNVENEGIEFSTTYFDRLAVLTDAVKVLRVVG